MAIEQICQYFSNLNFFQLFLLPTMQSTVVNKYDLPGQKYQAYGFRGIKKSKSNDNNYYAIDLLRVLDNTS